LFSQVLFPIGVFRKAKRQRKSIMHNAQSATPNKILRIRQVCEKTGMSRAWIYGAIKSGCFPAPLRLGIRSVGWEEQGIDGWISSRISKEVNNG
jgi:prophage regulatory protein